MGDFSKEKGACSGVEKIFFPSGLATFWQLIQKPKMATWGIPGGASSRGLLAFTISMKFPPRPRPESATKWTTLTLLDVPLHAKLADLAQGDAADESAAIGSVAQPLGALKTARDAAKSDIS